MPILTETYSRNNNISLLKHIDSMIELFDSFTQQFPFYVKFRNDFIKLAVFHDIGKVVKSFQTAISTQTPYKSYHNIISYAFLKRHTNLPDYITDAILFHHVFTENELDKCIYTKSLTNLNDETYNAKFRLCPDDKDIILTAINEGIEYLESQDITDTHCWSDSISNQDTFIKPYYQLYDQLLASEFDDYFASFQLCHAMLIFFDRLESSDEYNIDYFKQRYSLSKTYDISNILSNLKDKPGIDLKRLSKQSEILSANKPVINIKFPCGGGKTLSILLKTIQLNKKAIFVCNTNSLCDITYNNITNDIKLIGVDLSVGVFYGNEYKIGSEDSDILIMNIDAFSYKSLKNNLLHTKFDIYNKTLVFDECHEFVLQKDNGINAMYFAVMLGKILRTVEFSNNSISDWDGNVIINSSATFPDYITHTAFDGLPCYDNLESTPHNGDNKITIQTINFNSFSELSLFASSHTGTVFYIPTIPNTQELLSNTTEHEIMFGLHSRYETDTIHKRFSNFIEMYNGKVDTQSNPNVAGTSYIERGANYTTRSMLICPVSPFNLSQLNGRLCRFENNSNATLTIALLTNKNKLRYIDYLYENSKFGLYDKFVSFILNELKDKTLTIDEIQQKTKQFVHSDVYSKCLRNYFNEIYRNSVDFLKGLTITKGNQLSNKTQKILSSQLSIRGENNTIYVLVHDDNGVFVSLPVEFDERNMEYSSKKVKRYWKQYLATIDNNQAKELLHTFKYRLDKVPQNKLLSYAKDPKTPLYLDNYSYNERLGLYKKKGV